MPLDPLQSQDPSTEHSFDTLRFQVKHNSALAVGSSAKSSSAAGRRLHGIPTPPYSETTSSASGSVGRSRKDSNDAFLSSRHATLTQDNSSQHLRPRTTHHAKPLISSRSPSAASSSNCTGSDTVGAQSPTQPHDSHFRSSRHTLTSETYSMTDSAASLSSTPSGSLTKHISNRPDPSMGESSTQPADDSPSAHRAFSSLSSHSPSQRRKRRSEMHERDVSQIRSESRLGIGNDDNDDDDEHSDQQQHTADQQHPFPRTSQHKYSPRKSTTLSVTSSRYDETEALKDDQHSPSRHANLHVLDTNSPLTPTSSKSSRYTAAEELPSGSVRRLVRTTGRTSGRHSLDDRTSPRLGSPTRIPMPAEFRMPDKQIRRAYRAAHQRNSSDPDDSEGSEVRDELVSASKSSKVGQTTAVRSPIPTRRDSLDEIQEEGVKQPPTNSPTQHRRRRYASDAAADESATRLDYDGRLGTQGSRISVDSSSAQRHLVRTSQHSTPSSSTRRTTRSSEIGSPSEEARARKISSTSSSRSQKSSSSASELHRAASRVSMRKQYGSDLFSAEPLPSAPNNHPRSHSPSGRTEHSLSLTNSSDRSRPLHGQQRRIDDAALDSLRNQIEDLRIGRSEGELDRRTLPPVAMRNQALLGSTRSSLDLKSPTLGSARPQSVMGLQRTPNDAVRVHHYPFTDPQRSRYDRSWPTPDPGNSSDAAQRIHELVSLRGGIQQRQSAPLRSATAMDNASESIVASPSLDPRQRAASNGEEPAPIRNLAIRLSQYEALYSKAPSADASTSAAAGPHTARTVELMGAIVHGTSTMWAELSSMHPIATEGHLMGRQGDALTDAFGQLDEGLAFVNKLVLEQARAVQDLLFLLDRTEKERQAQFNQALVEMGHSPRPFSRIGSGAAALTPGEAKFANGFETSGSAERNAHLLRRATSSVRAGSSLQTDSPSPFVRSSRGVGSADRSGTLTATQIRSMTSLGHASNHARSASELSPSSSAAQRRLDRVALQLPREGSQDSPLSSRRSVIGRPFPTSDADQIAASSSNTSATGAATARPAPAFTPRRPRLSNPSVSNATASFQPSTVSAASSAVASSPENSLHNGLSGGEQMESEGSTIGGEHAGVTVETDEFGRVIADPLESAETVRLSSRTQRVRSERSREAATIRGGPRVIDTLTSQLDTLRSTNGEPDDALVSDAPHASMGHSAQRRHTINFHTTAALPSASLEDDDANRSPPKLSQYGLTKSSNPPPRPPRHIQRPSEEHISSPGRRTQQAQREEPSTPTCSVVADMGTPRQADVRSAYVHDQQPEVSTGLGASSVVRSLGRTAARRMSRVLGSGPAQS
ncbi:uncharacterized protein UTRI_01195 [Ustilago trichophora]|uniref:Uncharacterized protein n=1 Tax=Ustilago trichophora TaxID=86804 RepID=A0A5C3DYY3_9BASI|nr:uncharacterized protein UTRI_01195 [Ustilago trichophora]